MRVAVDVRKLGDGGIGTYIRETLLAAGRLAADLDVVAFGFRGEESKLPLPRVEWIAVRAGKYSIAEHVTLPMAVRRARPDLYHSPHYVLPFGIGCPSVVTVHDLIHVLVPRTVIHPLYGRWMIASACRRAARVITVSETTARDLRERLSVPAAKIRVIPNGVHPRFRRLAPQVTARTLDALGVRRPYVLFVGNLLPHKNVPALIRAFAALPEPRPDLVLCGAGYGSGSPVWRTVDETGTRARVRALGTLDPESLVALYNGAECLATASLYEGFGLPLVEAFACGTPVVAAATGAVPEVAGDGAILVPPHRVDLLTDGMYRLLKDPALRQSLVEKGARRATSFSWEDAARKTLAIYEEVTSARR